MRAAFLSASLHQREYNAYFPGGRRNKNSIKCKSQGGARSLTRSFSHYADPVIANGAWGTSEQQLTHPPSHTKHTPRSCSPTRFLADGVEFLFNAAVCLPSAAADTNYKNPHTNYAAWCVCNYHFVLLPNPSGDLLSL